MRRVEVIRSPRRRRTVQARVVGEVIQVRIPAHMSAAEEQHHVAALVERLERRCAPVEVGLSERADRLADRYGLPRPASIRFVGNQRSRWGSCTIDRSDIRLSSKLTPYPGWVLDYVIVHELAHLVVPDHSPAFQALVARYPRAERARGYLEAKADGL